MKLGKPDPSNGENLYTDKTGAIIEAGMFLRMEDGSIELVYVCEAQDGTPTLGVNASNEDYLKANHPGNEDDFREFYPLSDFDLSNAELCQPEQAQGQGPQLAL